MRPITAIGFDADDTLWQNEQYYRLTEEHFAGLLGDYAEGAHVPNVCWRRKNATSSTTASASRASPYR